MTASRALNSAEHTWTARGHRRRVCECRRRADIGRARAVGHCGTASQQVEVFSGEDDRRDDDDGRGSRRSVAAGVWTVWPP